MTSSSFQFLPLFPVFSYSSVMAACVADADIILLSCGFFLLSSSFFIPRLISAVADCMSTILLHMVWPGANLECRSEMCCIWLAGNSGPKKSPSGHHRTTLSGSSQLRHVWTIGKKVLNRNVSPTCPYNMVNFSPLAAQIVSLVWGTPANVNGFRVLAALL